MAIVFVVQTVYILKGVYISNELVNAWETSVQLVGSKLLKWPFFNNVTFEFLVQRNNFKTGWQKFSWSTTFAMNNDLTTTV